MERKYKGEFEEFEASGCGFGRGCVGEDLDRYHGGEGDVYGRFYASFCGKWY